LCFWRRHSETRRGENGLCCKALASFSFALRRPRSSMRSNTAGQSLKGSAVEIRHQSKKTSYCALKVSTMGYRRMRSICIELKSIVNQEEPLKTLVSRVPCSLLSASAFQCVQRTISLHRANALYGQQQIANPQLLQAADEECLVQSLFIRLLNFSLIICTGTIQYTSHRCVSSHN